MALVFAIYMQSFRTRLMLAAWKQGLGTPVLQPCGPSLYEGSIESQPRLCFPILYATSQFQSLPLTHRT